MAKRPHQQQGASDICYDHNSRYLQYRSRTACGIEGRLQYLDQNKARQPDGIGNEREASHASIIACKSTVREQAGQNGFGKNDQASYRRHHQKSSQSDGPTKRCLNGFIIPSGLSLREARQQSRAERNADNTKRQLHDTVSVIEP